MHTINGNPATFCQVHRVILSMTVERLAKRAFHTENLANSIEEIMSERKASRRSLGRMHTKAPKYGYVAVVVPA